MKYALLVGMNYFGNNYLPDCQKDVDDIEKLLVDYTVEKHYQYTPAELVSYVNKINKLVKPDDTIVIYISGHGTQIPSLIEKDGYDEGLVFYTNRKFTILRDKDFVKITDTINCNVIIFEDTCYSGGMNSLMTINTVKFKQFEGEYVYELHLPTTKSISKKINFTACAETETSGSTGQGGVFTLALLKSLGGKQKSVSSLLTAVRKLCKGEQTPQLYVTGLPKTTKIF